MDFCVMDMMARDWQRRKREVMISGMLLSPVGTIDDRPQIPRNMLFRNRGDGTFEEIAAYAGVTATGWSWQPVFLDVDLDGYEDIIIPTGYFRDVNDMDVHGRKYDPAAGGQAGSAKAGSRWPAGAAVTPGTEDRRDLSREQAGRPAEDPGAWPSAIKET